MFSSNIRLWKNFVDFYFNVELFKQQLQQTWVRYNLFLAILRYSYNNKGFKDFWQHSNTL